MSFSSVTTVDYILLQMVPCNGNVLGRSITQLFQFVKSFLSFPSLMKLSAPNASTWNMWLQIFLQFHCVIAARNNIVPVQ